MRSWWRAALVVAVMLPVCLAGAAPDQCANLSSVQINPDSVRRLDRQGIEALLLLEDELTAAFHAGYSDDGKSIRTPFTAAARADLSDALASALARTASKDLAAALKGPDAAATLFQDEVLQYRNALRKAGQDASTGKGTLVPLSEDTAEKLFLLRAIKPRLAAWMEQLGGAVPKNADEVRRVVDGLILEWLEAQRELAQIRRIAALPEDAANLLLPDGAGRWRAVVASLDGDVERFKNLKERDGRVDTEALLLRALRSHEVTSAWQTHSKDAQRTLKQVRERLVAVRACSAEMLDRYLRMAKVRHRDFPSVPDAKLALRVRVNPGAEFALDGPAPRTTGSLFLVVRDSAITGKIAATACEKRKPGGGCDLRTSAETAEVEIDLGVELAEVVLVDLPKGDFELQLPGGGRVPNVRVDPARAAGLLRAIGLPPQLDVGVRGIKFSLEQPSLTVDFTWKALPSRTEWHDFTVHIDVVRQRLDDVRREVFRVLQARVQERLTAEARWMLDTYGLEKVEGLTFAGQWSDGVYDGAATVYVAAIDDRVEVPFDVDLSAQPARFRVGQMRASEAIRLKLQSRVEAWVKARFGQLQLPKPPEWIDGMARGVQIDSFELVPSPGSAKVRVLCRVLTPANVGPSFSLTFEKAGGSVRIAAALDDDAFTEWVLREARKQLVAQVVTNLPTVNLFGLPFRVHRRDDGLVDLTWQGAPEVRLTAVRLTTEGADFSKAELFPSPADLARKFLPLPETFVSITNARLSNSGLHFDAFVRSDAWGDILIGSYVFGPKDRKMDVSEARRQALEAVAQRLKISALVIPGLGTLQDTKVNTTRTRIDGSNFELWLDATARIDVGGTLPVQVRLPKLKVEIVGDAKDLFLKNVAAVGAQHLSELLAGASTGFKINAESFVRPLDGGGFVAGIHVHTLKFPLWIFEVSLEDIELSTRAVRLPYEYSARFGASIPIGTTGLTIARPGFGYNTRTDAFRIQGDLAFIGQGLENILKIDSSLVTNWKAAQFELSGNLVLSSFLNLMEVSGQIQLSHPKVMVQGRTTGPIARLIRINGSADLIGDQKRATANADVAIFGLTLYRSTFEFIVPTERVKATSRVDLPFLASAETGFNSSFQLRDAELTVKTALTLGRFTLSDLQLLASLAGAEVAFKVLGVEFTLWQPSVLSMTPRYFLEAILAIFDIDLDDVVQVLKNILDGKIEIRLSKGKAKGSDGKMGKGDPVSAPKGSERPGGRVRGSGNGLAAPGKGGPGGNEKENGKGSGHPPCCGPPGKTEGEKQFDPSAVVGAKHGKVAQGKIELKTEVMGWSSIMLQYGQVGYLLGVARSTPANKAQFAAAVAAGVKLGELSTEVRAEDGKATPMVWTMQRSRKVRVVEDGGRINACLGMRCVVAEVRCRPGQVRLSAEQLRKRQWLPESVPATKYNVALFIRKVGTESELWAVEYDTGRSERGGWYRPFGKVVHSPASALGYACAAEQPLTSEVLDGLLGKPDPEPVLRMQQALDWCRPQGRPGRYEMGRPQALRCRTARPERQMWPVSTSCSLMLSEEDDLIHAISPISGELYSRCPTKELVEVGYEEPTVLCRDPGTGQEVDCLDTLFGAAVQKIPIVGGDFLPAGIDASNFHDKWVAGDFNLSPVKMEAWQEWIASYLDEREPPTIRVIKGAPEQDGLSRPELSVISTRFKERVEDSYRFVATPQRPSSVFGLEVDSGVWKAAGGGTPELFDSLRIFVHKTSRWWPGADANLVPLDSGSSDRLLLLSLPLRLGQQGIGYAPPSPSSQKEDCEAEGESRLVALRDGRVVASIAPMPGSDFTLPLAEAIDDATSTWDERGRPTFGKWHTLREPDAFIARILQSVTGETPRPFCGPPSGSLYFSRVQEGLGFAALWSDDRVTLIADQGRNRQPKARTVPKSVVTRRWKEMLCPRPGETSKLEGEFRKKHGLSCPKGEFTLTSEHQSLISELLSIRDMSWRDRIKVHPLYLVSK